MLRPPARPGPPPLHDYNFEKSLGGRKTLDDKDQLLLAAHHYYFASAFNLYVTEIDFGKRIIFPRSV